MSDLHLHRLRVGQRLGPLDLRLHSGRMTVVVGPNGAGKSTLLGVLAGLVLPEEGKVKLGDVDLAGLAPRQRAAYTAWLPQSPTVEHGLTAVEAVAAARYRHGGSAADQERRALDALRALGLDALSGRAMHTLSGGEAQRVRLASLVAQEAEWWLLDEPANHLDPAVRLDLAEVLRHRVVAGGSVVLVSHDLGLLPHLGPADIVVLKRGQVVHRGGTDDPALLGPLGEAFGLRLHRVPVDGGWALVSSGRSP